MESQVTLVSALVQIQKDKEKLMADRRCHLCFIYYNDEEGHENSSCIARIQEAITSLEKQLAGWRQNLQLAEKEKGDRCP